MAVLTACSKKETPIAKADASANAKAVDGEALIAGACLSCHTKHMLVQQRLTQAQWQKTVTKMVGWGANLDPSEVAPLVAYLSANYGPDAGPYTDETLTPAEALAEIAPTADLVPAGDAARGKALYMDKCGACHGADARGGLGVSLVDRPFLYRAADFTKTIRRGRGKMPPLTLEDAQIGDVLAHLRTLRITPPPP
jgi:mono/diheme cytochrome c family protein